MHEVFEHTADLGIRIRQSSFGALLSEAGMALFELMVEDLDTINQVERHTIHLTQSDKDLMLFDWLNELLYLFDARQLVLCRFDVTVEKNELHATVFGEPRDESRHPLDHEVKAITYHQLLVEEQADGEWLAEVILDI